MPQVYFLRKISSLGTKSYKQHNIYLFSKTISPLLHRDIECYSLQKPKFIYDINYFILMDGKNL